MVDTRVKDITPVRYPECEKWASVHNKVVAIKNFLQQVAEEDEFFLLNDNGFAPSSLDDLLYKFFDVNPNKLEAERRAMLEEMGG